MEGYSGRGPVRSTNLMCDLAFRSGYNEWFPKAGSGEAQKVAADCGEEPQIRERGEVCAVIRS